MSGVSTQEYRFSSKAASQLTSPACCRCVQKISTAKNVWGSTCDLDLVLHTCRYIKNFKKLGKKAMFFHQPGTLEEPGWTVILYPSQPYPEQQFSCFPTTLTWRQVGFSMVGDGWAFGPHQFFWLPACPRWGGPSVQRSSMKYESRERF